MPGPAVGPVGTSSHDSGLYAKDISDKIARLDDDIAPYIKVVSQLRKKRAINPLYYWHEKEPVQRFDRVTAAASAAATSLTVSNPTYFIDRDVIVNPRTGERMLVNGTPSTAQTTITVVRSLGTTAAAAINAQDRIERIGSALPDGVTSRESRAAISVEKTNYCEIFRTTYKLTGRALVTELYASTARKEARRDAMREHAVDVENTFLKGEKGTSTAVSGDSEATTTTDGLFALVGNNQVFDISRALRGGRLTEQILDDFAFMLTQFATGRGGDFMVLASAAMMSALKRLARNSLRTQVGERKFGVRITTYESPYGDLLFMRHPLFDGEVWGGYALGLNLNDAQYRFMKGRDMVARESIQANDLDGWWGEYLQDCGYQHEYASARTALIRGIRS